MTNIANDLGIAREAFQNKFDMGEGPYMLDKGGIPFEVKTRGLGKVHLPDKQSLTYLQNH